MESVPLRPKDSLPAKTNFAGFDVIRALAALGVVLLHACVPYLKNPMPGLAWPVQDAPSQFVDVVGWTIELFIMPLFLVLAGFLAWQTLQRRGPGPLLKGRAKRLLVPFAFGCLILLPITVHIWVLGWVVDGIVAPIKLRSFKFDGGIDRDLWGTSHLWFLQYLFLYVALLAVCTWVRRRFRFIREINAGTMTIAASLLTIAAITLFIRPNVVWGFQHAFYPVASKWIYSSLFFAAGLLLASRDPQLTWLQSRAGVFSASAVPLTLAAVYLGRWQLSGGMDNPRLANGALAVLSVLGATTVTLAIIGLSAKHIHRATTPVKYLAAASFWIYLVHHSIVGLVHLDLKVLFPNASPIIKTALAFLISVGVSLLTYEGLIRRTALGRLLGFAWSIPKEEAGEEDGQSATRRHAA